MGRSLLEGVIHLVLPSSSLASEQCRFHHPSGDRRGHAPGMESMLENGRREILASLDGPSVADKFHIKSELVMVAMGNPLTAA